jgi:tRNA(fMet)-specific endonuclease VapC
MRFLLDANAVIALLNDASSRAARRARRQRPDDIAISAIVAHELFYGAFKSRRVTQNVAVVDALQFVVLEFDREDARRAGEIRALLASRGSMIGPYDVLIGRSSGCARHDPGNQQYERIRARARSAHGGLASVTPQRASGRSAGGQRVGPQTSRCRSAK